MSTFNIVGIAFLAVVVIVGSVLKLALSKRRDKLDGTHGFVHKKEQERSKTDEWETL